ncbi:MAG: sarcosine oxidase subunit gamma family protein [Alphaproteobacteria bacterium]|jgi:sarcosine oxidase, subunit gamma|nr:sarcosine oxidase subunit gamma family protein [Alphaproteobacteria bacterium]
MADTYLRQSPLAHLHLDARAANEAADAITGVHIGERLLLGMINLRGQRSNPAFGPAVKKVVGAALPGVNKTSGKPEGVHVLGLGPDEWLIITPTGEEAGLQANLRRAVADFHAAATLTGESMTVIRLAGAHARGVLAKGCPVDIHPRVFGPGQCAQTILARADMTMHQTADDAYDIIVRRSFAEYVWTWLEDAAREYGVRVVTGLK